MPWTSADVTSPIRRRLDSAWCYESSPRSRQLGGSFPADLARVAESSLQSRCSSPFRREQPQSFLAWPYGTRETDNQIGRILHLPTKMLNVGYDGFVRDLAHIFRDSHGGLAGRVTGPAARKPGQHPIYGPKGPQAQCRASRTATSGSVRHMWVCGGWLPVRDSAGAVAGSGATRGKRSARGCGLSGTQPR